MSIAMMSLAWKVEGLSPTQKLVLLKLTDNANDEGVSWPSIPNMCKQCCLSDRSIQRAIQDLEKLQLLTTEKRNGHSTVYKINNAKLIHTSRQNVTPDNLSPPIQCHLPPDTVSPHPRQAVTTPPTQCHPEPLTNHQGTTKRTVVAKPKPVDNPKKVGRFFLDSGGGGWRFDPTDETHEELISIARGWDRQNLYEKYREFSKGREKPNHPQAAFLGWAKKYTAKGKRP
jgi:hypothetical protein